MILTSQRTGWQIILISTLICAAFRLYAINDSGSLLLAASIEDDSYYYIVPAYKWVQHGFVTFDGINKTYGWQPPWMLINMALALAASNIDALLRATMTAATCFYALSVLLLYRFALRLRFSPVISAGLLAFFFCFNIQMCEIFTRGKENALHFLVLISLLNVLADGMKYNHRRAVVAGLLLGLIELSRVTAGVIVLPFVFLTLRAYGGFTRAALRKLFITGVAAAAVALPWFIYAWHEFGTALPTSGVAKIGSASGAVHHLPHIMSSDQLIAALNGLGIVRDLWLEYTWMGSFSRVMGLGIKAFVIGLVILIALTFIGLLRGRRIADLHALSPTCDAWLLLNAYAFLNFVLHITMLRNYFIYGVWYHVPEYAALGLGACWMIPRPLSALSQNIPATQAVIKYAASVCLVFVLLLGCYSTYLRIRHNVFLPRTNAVALSINDATTFIEGHLPLTSPIGSFNSGIYGFLLPERQVVNMDGLANSLEYVHATHGGRDTTRAFLRRLNIQYIMDSEDLELIDDVGFMSLLPRNEYEIIWTGNREVWWGSILSQGKPKFMFILRLKDNAFASSEELKPLPQSEEGK